MQPSLPIIADARLSTLRALVAQGQTKHPALCGRLHSAAALALLADIAAAPDEPGTWLVPSERQPGTVYRVVEGTKAAPGSCQCPDQQQGRAPEGWCKHRLAVALLMVAANQEHDLAEQLLERAIESGEVAA